MSKHQIMLFVRIYFMQEKQHWENVYSSKTPESVSWFQLHANDSLSLIRNTKVDKHAAIIDVGGGASTLVDDLLADGYTNLTVLDLSITAINLAKQRLGNLASSVKWIEGDIMNIDFSENKFDIWHDRAVFHFFLTPNERNKYVKQAVDALKKNGYVIIGSFAQNGPEKCSGLPTMRYNASTLNDQFGDPFILIEHNKKVHTTPFNTEQKFVFCSLRKKE